MDKIILYGAGKLGRAMYDFLKQNNWSDIIYGFCDKEASRIQNIDGKPIYEFEELKDKEELAFCISMYKSQDKEEVIKKLENHKVIDFLDLAEYLHVDKVNFDREFCAFYHIESMDGYFTEAEKNLDVFWGESSAFLEMFQKLDLSNVVELACGRGRHVPMYKKNAGKITLVDILEKNIEFCKERFKNEKDIHYVVNNGYNLSELKSGEYTALFTYDAMVHFELIDIYSYLCDISRILKEGGKALFHHSNNGTDYKANFSSGPHARNFMTKDIFAYLSNRAGFTVLEQKVITWGNVENLDCISLIQKN